MKLNWNPPKINDRTAHLISKPDYSIYVVNGAERTDGTQMPARDFFTAAIAETDFEQQFVDEFMRSNSTDAAFEATTEALHDKIKEVISDDRWDWDRETQRQNGTIVTSPRDIVDTGELLEGQKVEYQE